MYVIIHAATLAKVNVQYADLILDILENDIICHNENCYQRNTLVS